MRSEHAGLPEHESSNAELAIDEPGQVHVPQASPLEEARQAVEKLNFPSTLRPTERSQQRALENEYVDWLANNVIMPRRSAFGESRYQLDANMPAAVRDMALPAAYQFVRQFLSSSSRSPVRNALLTELAPKTSPASNGHGQTVAPGELFHNAYDSAVVSGFVGGVTAYVADVALTAMDRRAQLSNMPTVKAVDLKALIPDPPPVVLTVKDGNKTYARVGSEGAPNKLELEYQTKSQRDGIGRWQLILSGKVEGMLYQPMFAGALNAFRRRMSSDLWLTTPGKVFLGSAWSSGTGGALAKGSLELLKGAPRLSQTTVDDFVGGQQRVNMFRSTRPHAGQPAPGLSDLPQLPRFAWDVIKEAGAMYGHSLDVFRRPLGEVGRQALDVGLHGVSNLWASVTSPGTGELLAQVIRGSGNGAAAGESLRSRGYLLQQFGQSGTNDFIWQLAKEGAKAGGYDLAASLDRRRNLDAIDLAREARTAATRLSELAGRQPDIQVGANTPSRPEPVRHAIDQLRLLQSEEVPSAQELRQVHGALAAWKPEDDANRLTRSAILRGLADVMEPLERRAAIEAWRTPRSRQD